MAIKITEEIPEQGFELVMYKIALILAEELQNQKDTYDNIGDFEVYADRMTPYDKSENIMLNVSIATGNYGNFTESSTEGKISYHVEVYTVNEKSRIKAGEAEKYKLHRVAGMVRYILQSHKYKRLDFPAGIIAGTYVETIQFFDDYNNNDGANTRVCIITFSVRTQEEQEVWNGVTLTGNTTQFKLEETDKGYKIIKNT